MLNLASATALFGAFSGLFAALCVAPLGRVPDWEDLRPLTWVAITAALMSACDVVDPLDVAPALHVWSNRVQVFAISLHVLAWLAYLQGWAKRPGRTLVWTWPLAVLAVAALVPGLVYGDALRPHPLPWADVVYQDPSITPAGLVIWAIIAVYAIAGLWRMARWSRSGAPYPAAHLAALGTLFLVVVHDSAIESGLPLPTPYLLGVGTAAMMVVFGVLTLRRISKIALEHHRLRGGLESAIVDRSRLLEESQLALARAERLAALGQFSAGVAHEVSPPAEAAAEDLEALAAVLEGDPRPEVGQRLGRAQRGVRRIAALARQLLVAGGDAGGDRPLEPVRLVDAVQTALVSPRARAEGRVQFTVDVPPELWVHGQQEPLVQVLSILLMNGVRAIPAVRGGTVAVRAAALVERVQLVVQDDGVGMSDDELRHVFEPFHGTKAPGQGTGLGLAVARTLVEAMCGSLRFESAVGRGTQAILELDRAEGPTGVVQPSRPATSTRATLLVIDDDADVLRSVARLLGRQHQVRTAAGVKEGLAAILEQDFDLVLVDVMMPDGGGERFWAELLLQRPALMNRVAFITGGASTPEARAFVRRQPRPILTKPFDSMAIDELLSALGPTRAAQSSLDPSDTHSGAAALGKLKR